AQVRFRKVMRSVDHPGEGSPFYTHNRLPSSRQPKSTWICGPGALATRGEGRGGEVKMLGNTIQHQWHVMKHFLIGEAEHAEVVNCFDVLLAGQVFERGVLMNWAIDLNHEVGLEGGE